MHVEKKILAGCKHMCSHLKESMFVKLDKDSFHFEHDLIIGAEYLSPERSLVFKRAKQALIFLRRKLHRCFTNVMIPDLGGWF